MATDSFLNSKIVQVEDGDEDGEGSYPGLSQGSDGAQNRDDQRKMGGGREGEWNEEDVYTQSEGLKKLRKCPEAVDAFKVLWTVSKSVAQHDLGKYTAVYNSYVICTNLFFLFLISSIILSSHLSSSLLFTSLIPPP